MSEEKNETITEWSWDHTALHDENHTILKVSEIKQLLLNRGENKKKATGNKIDLVKKLKQKYTVKLNKPLTSLTGKQLVVELKLRCLSCKSSKKQALIERLTNSTPTIQSKPLNETSETLSIEIPWQHTEYKDLNIQYLQQLLINRGVNEADISENKNELMKALEENHTVKLKEPIHHFSCNEIKSELSLYGITFDGNQLKSALINQYKAMIKHHTICKDWIYVANAAYVPHIITDLYMINNKEFIVASEKQLQIGNMNPNKVTWSEKLMTYNTEKKFFYGWDDTHIACVDTRNELMYVYCFLNENNKRRFFIINYGTKTVIKKMMKNLPTVRMPAKLVFVHGKVHLIGDNKHWIFDSKKRKFNVVHIFDAVIEDSVIMNVGYGNKIIMLVNGCKQFYEYNNKWSKKLNVASGVVIRNIECCVVTENEQYGILFRTNDLNIYVIDLKEMKLYKSSVKCVKTFSLFNGYSQGDKLKAMITYSQGNKLKQELMAFGYVRDCFKVVDIGMNIFPPFYIVKMIEEYATDEFVYVLEKVSWHNNKQRKIRVNDIINDMTSI